MNRARVRDRAAKAAFRAARRLGVQVEYKTPGGSYAAFWGFVNSGGPRKIGLLGGETDTDEIEFIIPRQTNFPPTSFLPGAQIRYPITTGDVFAVIEIEEDNEDIHQASTFKLSCERYAFCTVEND